MNTNINIQNFSRVMDKYKFIRPIPPAMQSDVIAAGQKDLKLIYKRFGRYGIIFAVLLFMYNQLGRAGFSVTFFKCKIILAAMAALIATAGIYSTAKIAQHYIKQPVIDESAGTQENLYDRPSPSLKEKQATLPYIIGIDAFRGADEALTVIVTDKIFKNLQNILGEDKITRLGNTNRRKLPRVIDGSVRKLGDGHNIIIKIVNITTAKTEFAATEKFRTEAEVDEACRRISERIAVSLRR